MASSSRLIEAMNNITLEDEEGGRLAIDGDEEVGNEQLFSRYDAKLCLVARLITDGQIDFSAMQQTLATLWKPGRGVYIKELLTFFFSSFTMKSTSKE